MLERKTKLDRNMVSFETNDPVYTDEPLCVETKILLVKGRKKEWKFIWVDI